MTISTPPSPLSYNGDGSTTAFPITWTYFDKSHVVATLRAADGSETTWTLGTQYTLTPAGVEAGGTLTVNTSPTDFTPQVGEKLFITLDPPNTQGTSLPLGGAFPSPAVEQALDISAQRDGKLEALLDRCLIVPTTDPRTGAFLVLPIDTTRANKFLAFNSDGDPVAAELVATADLVAILQTVNTWTAAQTFDANTTVGTATTGRTLTLRGPDETFRVFRISGSSARLWEVFGSNAAHTGGNAGTDLGITRFDDAGITLGSVLSVSRSNGAVKAGDSPTGGFAGADVWNYSQTPRVNNKPLMLVLDRDVSAAEVVNTTTETTVYSFSVPGGTLGTDNVIRLTLLGDWETPAVANGTVDLRVKYGSTHLIAAGANNFLRHLYTNTAADEEGSLHIQVDLRAAGSTGGQIGMVQSRLYQAIDAAQTEAQNNLASINTGVAEDSTQDLDLVVTIQLTDADAAFAVRVQNAILEIL